MPFIPGIPITKDAILSRVKEEEIFEYYLGLPVHTNVFYINPLRPDNKPGCRYYYNSLGRLKFKDFSHGYNWDCFNVVEFKYGLTFIDALKRIIKDFQLRETKIKHEVVYIPQKKERPIIKVAVRDWSEKDIKFWQVGNINTDILKFFEVYPIKAVWYYNQLYKCVESDPCYCYYFRNELYKLYFPLRKEVRFIQNIFQVEDDLLQGYLKLPPTGEYLILTKSYKDVMSMYSFGLTSCAILSETHLIKAGLYNELLQRFKVIYTLFDNDAPGRRSTLMYQKTYNTIPLIFPFTWEKDWFANVKVKGVPLMNEVTQQFINNRTWLKKYYTT